MSCNLCSLTIGNNYTITECFCDKCDTRISPIIGEYVGRAINVHLFRIHPVFICKACKKELKWAMMACDDFDVLEVTDEFKLLQNTKDSYWLGK